MVEKYLFILFGVPFPGDTPSNETRVLDLEKMSWASLFEAPEATRTSAGTIAGAVIGSVAGVS